MATLSCRLAAGGKEESQQEELVRSPTVQPWERGRPPTSPSTAVLRCRVVPGARFSPAFKEGPIPLKVAPPWSQIIREPLQEKRVLPPAGTRPLE